MCLIQVGQYLVCGLGQIEVARSYKEKCVKEVTTTWGRMTTGCSNKVPTSYENYQGEDSRPCATSKTGWSIECSFLGQGFASGDCTGTKGNGPGGNLKFRLGGGRMTTTIVEKTTQRRRVGEGKVLCTPHGSLTYNWERSNLA